jgi:uncharacterized membrane protein
MKKLLSLCAAAALVAFVGCGPSPSGTGGNPSNPKEQFKLTLSKESVTVKKGASTSIDVTVKKEADFKEVVTLSESVPENAKGLTAKLSQDKVEKSAGPETKVTLDIKAADDAAVGDHEVKVTAKPEQGAAVSQVVKVKVE